MIVIVSCLLFSVLFIVMGFYEYDAGKRIILLYFSTVCILCGLAYMIVNSTTMALYTILTHL